MRKPHELSRCESVAHQNIFNARKRDTRRELIPGWVKIAQYVANTPSEGPYRRFALWTQGCSIGCRGCCNPAMQDPDGGEVMEVTKLVDIILNTQGIEGITLLGGEPFQQALPLAKMAIAVREAGLGVMAFTGYTLESLTKQGKAAHMLLEETDALIAGPYIKERGSSKKRWIGSDNQKVHFLSSRYKNCKEFQRPGQSIHLSFSDDAIAITGFPDLFPV